MKTEKSHAKQLLVALHVLNASQVFLEAEKILTEKGAHGVILVNNNLHFSKIYAEELLYLAVKIKEKYPNYLIGVNPLELSTDDAILAISLPKTQSIDLLWTDNGGILENNSGAYLYAPFDFLIPQLKTFDIKFFGSIALKYQKPVKNLTMVAKEASKYFDVIVTSGDMTGVPPSIEKITEIKNAVMNKKPIALASGMTIENVKDYLPLADIFIVGTTFWEDDEWTNNQKKIEEFREVLDNYVPEKEENS